MDNVEGLDERLQTMTTAELFRHALAEARLLAKAEVLHAKEELRAELKLAVLSGALFGVALALGLCALALIFTAIAVALPVTTVAGLFIVAGALVVIAAILGLAGWKKLPRKPLPRTQDRLRQDLALTREQFA